MDKWVRDVRERGGAPSGAPVAPASTVVLLRDTTGGIEVLLARRSSKLKFHGGAWVFPGGRIDPEDFGDDPDDIVAAARRAAAREAWEEVRMRVDPDALVHLSKWTTPDISPKRFETWFFAARASDDRLVVDGGETQALRWFRPRDALAAREAGEIEIAPPQYVSLLELHDFPSVEVALAEIEARPSIDVTPRFCFLDEGGAICVYDDDVAYADPDLDLDRPGPRHRLLMLDDGWRYERDTR